MAGGIRGGVDVGGTPYMGRRKVDRFASPAQLERIFNFARSNETLEVYRHPNRPAYW